MKTRIIVVAILLGTAMVTTAQDLDTNPKAARAAVHGNCQVAVNVQFGGSNTEDCALLVEDRETGTVPASMQLLVEHASAQCAGPQAGEIAYLAIHTKSTLKAPPQPSYIPLNRRPLRNGAVQTRYLASVPVSLYAGPGTKVTVKLVLEPDAAVPLGHATTCDVRFQGYLRFVEKARDPL